MANPLRGEASFEAGGEAKTLTFDVNVFCDLEDETGLGVNDLVAEMQASPSFKLLRSMICAGLQTKHPGTTIQEAGRIMSDAGIDDVTGAIERALIAAMPEAAEDGDVRPPNRKARRAAKK